MNGISSIFSKITHHVFSKEKKGKAGKNENEGALADFLPELVDIIAANASDAQSVCSLSVANKHLWAHTKTERDIRLIKHLESTPGIPCTVVVAELSRHSYINPVLNNILNDPKILKFTPFEHEHRFPLTTIVDRKKINLTLLNNLSVQNDPLNGICSISHKIGKIHAIAVVLDLSEPDFKKTFTTTAAEIEKFIRDDRFFLYAVGYNATEVNPKEKADLIEHLQNMCVEYSEVDTPEEAKVFIAKVVMDKLQREED